MKKICFAIFFLSIVQCINAQVWNQNDLLLAPDASDLDRFGEIRYHGDRYMVVASHGADIQLGDNTIEDAGAVYIWERGKNEKWVFLQKLSAPAGFISKNSFFGQRAALFGEHMVISDYASNFDQIEKGGMVFYYKLGFDGLFHYVGNITSRNPHENKYFGSDLGLTDKFLAVGVAGDNFDQNESNPISQAGSVEMFILTQDGDWIYHEKFVSSQRGIGHQFGRELVISGEELFISDSKHSFNVENSPNQKMGKVHYYKHNNLLISKGWKYISSIENPWYGINTFFGMDLALSGNTLLISEPSFHEYISGEEPKTFTGKVHVFEKELRTNIWTEIASLKPEKVHVNMQFGINVAINGDFIAVSCPGDNMDANGENEINQAGSAFIYSKKSGEWQFLQKIVAPERKDLGYFCSGLGIHEGYMVMGDYRSKGKGMFQGSVISYKYEPTSGKFESVLDMDVSIYPNPTRDYLTVDLGNVRASHLTIRSISGAVLKKESGLGSRCRLDLSDLKAGMYFLSVHTEKEIITKRIVVR